MFFIFIFAILGGGIVVFGRWKEGEGRDCNAGFSLATNMGAL